MPLRQHSHHENLGDSVWLGEEYQEMLHLHGWFHWFHLGRWIVCQSDSPQVNQGSRPNSAFRVGVGRVRVAYPSDYRATARKRPGCQSIIVMYCCLFINSRVYWCSHGKGSFRKCHYGDLMKWWIISICVMCVSAVNHSCWGYMMCVCCTDNLLFNYLQWKHWNIMTLWFSFSCLIEFTGISTTACRYHHDECDRWDGGHFSCYCLYICSGGWGWMDRWIQTVMEARCASGTENNILWIEMRIHDIQTPIFFLVSCVFNVPTQWTLKNPGSLDALAIDATCQFCSFCNQFFSLTTFNSLFKLQAHCHTLSVFAHSRFH